MADEELIIDLTDPEQIKAKQRRLRDGFSTALSLRVHRAISLLRRTGGLVSTATASLVRNE